MSNYVICNTAYGPQYTELFLRNHVKSILDETNLPAVAKEHNVTYYVLSDRPSLGVMANHPNMIELSKTVRVVGIPFVEAVSYETRYDSLGKMLRFGVEKALAQDGLLTVFAADGVVGKGFFTSVLSHIKEGYESVFTVPMRAAVEPIQKVLDEIPGALTKEDLFKLGYANLHPLWLTSHYGSPHFNRMPYTMLWNTEKGMLGRSFSVSPMLFKPNEAMKKALMADYDLPSMCTKPKWLENWYDAPMIGAEPLACFYPMFDNTAANVDKLASGFCRHLHPTQMEFVKHRFYYPSIEEAGVTPIIQESSDFSVDGICKRYKELNP